MKPHEMEVGRRKQPEEQHDRQIDGQTDELPDYQTERERQTEKRQRGRWLQRNWFSLVFFYKPEKRLHG